MRPLQFPRLAPNGGLSIGKSIADGMNNAMNNYARMRMQRAQMEAHKAQAQAMQTWRQAQAEQLRQKSVGSSAADLQLMQAMVKGGHIDPAVVRGAMKDRVEQFLSNARPEEKTALTQHINQQMDQGQIPEELAGQITFSANQLRAMQGMAGNQTKENVAGTNAGAKIAVQDKKDSTWRDITGQKIQGAKDVAKIHAGSADVVSQRKSLTDQMRQVSTSMSALDKPPAPGGIPLDDTVKAQLKEHYGKQLMDLHGQYQSIGAQSPQAPAGNAPAGSQPPQQPRQQSLSWDQRSKASVGDSVTGPNGQSYVVGGKDPNGKLLLKAAQAAPQAPAQAAPQQQGPAPAPQPAAQAPTPAPAPMAPTPDLIPGGQ